MTVRVSARALLGLSVAAFLVVADLHVALEWRWQAVRLALLGVAMLAAAAVLAARPRALGALVRFPLVFFTIFAAIDVVASVVSTHPVASLRYAVGLLAVEAVAVAAAEAFSPPKLVSGLMATVAVKIAISVAVAGSSDASWSGSRFMGVLGSPNPMGATAGLGLLLIVLHGWYHWPRTPARVALAAAGLVASIALAATRSASAMVGTLVALVALIPVSGARRANERERLAWMLTAVALLLPLIAVAGGIGVAPARISTPTESIDLRMGWWGMLIQAISHQPWLGYGANGTRLLGLPGTPPWGTSAHNLYLEAAVWAGIPAAAAMALFVLGLVAAMMRRARLDRAAGVGLAVPVLLYATLSLVEPILLNAAPSTLVVTLVIAAASSMDAPARARAGA